MHTYIKYDDGTYGVGLWLPNHEGITTFVRMFDVVNRDEAIEACNVLNGGSYRQINIANEY